MLKLNSSGRGWLLAAIVFTSPLVAFGQSGYLTVQVGSAAPPPTSLVDHTNTWRWHKGTNAPAVGWQTNTDASLDATWGSGPGGFGYSNDTANETNQCRTILFDMSGTSATNYSTFYIRKSVQIVSAVDPTTHIQLTMDYDDAFVAYLDGVEVARSANAPGSVGTEPLYTGLATSTHESSRGTSTPVNPPSVLDLGAVGSRLGVGTHVLAVIGLNQNKSTSSDFILIADLALTGGAGSVTGGPLLSIVPGSSVALSGSNTLAGSTRVTVNGDEAAFDSVNGTWSKTNSLVPGVNKLFIAALDDLGNLLAYTNRLLVSEVSSTTVGGTLATNTVWTPAMGIIRVTSTAIVPQGGSLAIGNGAVVLLAPGVSIRATNASLTATGTVQNRVYFLPSDGSSTWSGLISAGASGQMTLQHVETIAGCVQTLSGATSLLEDNTFRDYLTSDPPIVYGNGAASVTLRRCHTARCYEWHFISTLLTVEDCLNEEIGYPGAGNSDGIDLDSTPVGSVVRRTTVRRSRTTNIDAVDIGTGCNETVVENCLFSELSDKGVSIGENSHGIIVRNCVMFRCDSGVAVKDSSTAELHDITVNDCDFGFRVYQKHAGQGGGHITNAYNNILWGNTNSLEIDTLSTVVMNYSDVQGTNFPGTGNINADPLFVNAALRDYNLSVGSPAIGNGQGGANMGVTYPVGGIPGAPFALAAVGNGSGPVQLAWQDDADNETSFVIERSTDAANWSVIGSAGGNVTNYTDSTVVAGTKYYYRVSASNGSGTSESSNLASSRALIVVAGGNVGGTISQDTCWADNGTFIVTSTVTVASGVTLYIKPGAQVLFNTGFGININGRMIAEGTEGNLIHFARNGGATSWTRLNFGTSPFESRIAYAVIDGATSSGNVQAVNTSIYLDHIVFTNTLTQLVTMDDSSCIIQFCTFPSIQNNELLHFLNMPPNGHALIASNLFGTLGIPATSGYNDLIDFTGGNRPGPIVRFIGNIFLSAVDDVFDMDGTDAHIEGNIFLNVRQDAQRDSGSYPITTGANGADLSQLVVCRNIFYNCEHTLLIKDHGSMIAQNNTVVRITTNTTAKTAAGAQITPAIIAFSEPWRGVPGGDGAIFEGNIVWDLEAPTFTYFTNGVMFLDVNHSLIQGTNVPGVGNISSDPMFVNSTNLTYLNIRSNLALLPGSPAIGTGPNGIDMGALAPGGASISGEPAGATTNRSAVLKVAGPGIYAYKWKLNNGPWSTEVPLTNTFLITATMFANAQPITLSNLADGTYTVSVVGKNSAGDWQSTDTATVSKTWTVGVADTDGDGMPDDWEDAHGLNKLVNDASGDADGDGMTNLQEYLAGTDPQVFGSNLRLFSLSEGSGNFYFHFVAVSNKSYTVQYRPSLSTGVWQRLQDFVAVSTNRTLTVTNAPGTMRFYQIVTPLAP